MGVSAAIDPGYESLLQMMNDSLRSVSAVPSTKHTSCIYSEARHGGLRALMIDRLSSSSWRGATLPGSHATLCKASIRPIGPGCMQPHKCAIHGARSHVFALKKGELAPPDCGNTCRGGFPCRAMIHHENGGADRSLLWSADASLRIPRKKEDPASRLILRAHASPVLGSLGEGIEGPIQVVYLSILLSFLVVGAYLVVRQVLARRELEEAAKVFGDRVRSGEGSGEVRGFGTGGA